MVSETKSKLGMVRWWGERMTRRRKYERDVQPLWHERDEHGHEED